MAQLLNLPDQFHFAKGPGGGLTYGSASEAVLTALTCARLQKPGVKHVMYTSDQAHFSVEKAAIILGVEYRLIPAVYDASVQNYPVSLENLKKQIALDKKNGLTPTFVCANVGSTNLGATDDLKAIGQLAEEENMWFHIDAAYAGCLFMLPELRHKIDGVEKCTSINLNTSKMLNAGIDSSNM